MKIPQVKGTIDLQYSLSTSNPQLTITQLIRELPNNLNKQRRIDQPQTTAIVIRFRLQYWSTRLH